MFKMLLINVIKSEKLNKSQERKLFIKKEKFI